VILTIKHNHKFSVIVYYKLYIFTEFVQQYFTFLKQLVCRVVQDYTMFTKGDLMGIVEKEFFYTLDANKKNVH